MFSVSRPLGEQGQGQPTIWNELVSKQDLARHEWAKFRTQHPVYNFDAPIVIDVLGRENKIEAKAVKSRKDDALL